MEVLFQIVSYIGEDVSPMFGTITGAAYQSLYTGARSAAGWLVWVQVYCGQLIQSSSNCLTEYNRICNQLGHERIS